MRLVNKFRYLRTALDRRIIAIHTRPVEKAMLKTSTPLAIVYSLSIGLLYLAYSFDSNVKIREQTIEDSDDDEINEPEIE